MRISPIKLFNNSIKQINFSSSNTKSYVTEPKDETVKVPGEIYRGLYLNQNQKYSYKPVASLKPIKEFIGYYNDLDKFSELYAKKVNSNLLIPTKNDIKNLISRIQKATGENEGKIKEVLYNLTLFSSYNSFNILQEVIDREDIGEFGLKDRIDNDPAMFDFSSNPGVEYLASKKEFLNMKGHNKTGYILDNSSLSQLENYKNSKNEYENEIYNDFIEDVKNNKVVFLNIKGWDIKTKTNGYKNANFLSGSGYLEDLAIEVIKQIQSGKKEDSIYFSDFKERLNNLVGDSDIIKNIKIVEIYSKPKIATDKEILDNIASKALSKEKVKRYIENFIKNKPSSYPKERVQEALLKYLDEQTEVYSIDSISCALKKMNREIEATLKKEGYDKQDIAYIVPKCLKSYSLITSMYSQINDIDLKNVNSMYFLNEENQKKAAVILDDISASGASEGNVCYEYKVNYPKNNPLVYAPVIMCSYAESPENRLPNSFPDKYCFNRYMYDLTKPSRYSDLLNTAFVEEAREEYGEDLEKYVKNGYKLLNSEDCKILNEILFKGYVSNAVSVMFPYMIPDNASDIASLMFGELLYKENTSTNKLWTFLQNRKKLNKKDFNCYEKIRKSC